MNLRLLVCTSQPSFQTPSVVRKQRKHGLLVPLKALDAFGGEMNDEDVGHAHAVILHRSCRLNTGPPTPVEN